VLRYHRYTTVEAHAIAQKDLILSSLLILAAGLFAATPGMAQTDVDRALSIAGALPRVKVTLFQTTEVGFVAGSTGSGPLDGYGKIRRTEDGTTTWTDVYTGTANGTIHALVFRGETTGLASEIGDGTCNVLRTADGGISWSTVHQTTTATEVVLGFSMPSDTTTLALTARSLGISTNNGATWTWVSTVPWSTGPAAYDIAFSSATHGTVLAREGSTEAVYRSTDGGATWFVSAPAPMDQLRSRIKAMPTVGGF
jgi:hypothetical protein